MNKLNIQVRALVNEEPMALVLSFELDDTPEMEKQALSIRKSINDRYKHFTADVLRDKTPIHRI